MTDRTPDAIDIENAEQRLWFARDVAEAAAALRDRITDADSCMPNPLTLDVHAILHAALEAAEAPLERAVSDARRELAYATGELQRPQPTVRHRDAITGQYVDADEAAARPETTVRETRKP